MKVWSAPGLEECLVTVEVPWVYSLAVSPDSQLLAAGCGDGKVRLLTPDGEVKEVLEGHARGVNCVCFDGPGATLASSSTDRTARVWTLDPALVEQVVLRTPRLCVHCARLAGLSLPSPAWWVSAVCPVLRWCGLLPLARA